MAGTAGFDSSPGILSIIDVPRLLNRLLKIKAETLEKPEWLTLCWNGQSLGRIIHVAVFDWPWVCGHLIASEWPPTLRDSIEALARETASDDDLPDSPYVSGFYDGWTVIDPTGVVIEISVPVVDFATGSIEWR